MSERESFRYERAEESPGFLLWQVTTPWRQKLETVLAEFAITQTQYVIMASLLWLESEGPITQGTLAGHTKMDKMTLSKAIRKLEVAGFVSRRDSSKDGRAVCVTLTASGRKIVAKAVKAVESADEEFFSGLSREERGGFIGTLSSLCGKAG